MVLALCLCLSRSRECLSPSFSALCSFRYRQADRKCRREERKRGGREREREVGGGIEGGREVERESFAYQSERSLSLSLSLSLSSPPPPLSPSLSHLSLFSLPLSLLEEVHNQPQSTLSRPPLGDCSASVSSPGLPSDLCRTGRPRDTIARLRRHVATRLRRHVATCLPVIPHIGPTSVANPRHCCVWLLTHGQVEQP